MLDRCLGWVEPGRTQPEQMSSGLPPKADIALYSRHVSKVPPKRTLHWIWGFPLAKRRVRCLRSNESYPVKPEHWETAMGIKSHTAATTAALALGLFFTPPVSIAIDAIANTVAPLVPAAIGNLGFMSPAVAQPAALTKQQSDALNTYNDAVKNFKSILGERRAQINSKSTAAELAGTGTLPCTHQHDEHLQGPHRRAALQNRKAQ